MYVSINTLTASFTSIGFKATVNISRIIVQSTTPEWRQATNLRQTRIKDDEKDEVINFKEIKWGTMRVHADAAYMSEVGCIVSFASLMVSALLKHSGIVVIVIKGIGLKQEAILDVKAMPWTSNQLIVFTHKDFVGHFYNPRK